MNNPSLPENDTISTATNPLLLENLSTTLADSSAVKVASIISPQIQKDFMARIGQAVKDRIDKNPVGAAVGFVPNKLRKLADHIREKRPYTAKAVGAIATIVASPGNIIRKPISMTFNIIRTIVNASAVVGHSIAGNTAKRDNAIKNLKDSSNGAYQDAKESIKAGLVMGAVAVGLVSGVGVPALIAAGGAAAAVFASAAASAGATGVTAGGAYLGGAAASAGLGATAGSTTIGTALGSAAIGTEVGANVGAFAYGTATGAAAGGSVIATAAAIGVAGEVGNKIKKSLQQNNNDSQKTENIIAPRKNKEFRSNSTSQQQR